MNKIHKESIPHSLRDQDSSKSQDGKTQLNRRVLGEGSVLNVAGKNSAYNPAPVREGELSQEICPKCKGFAREKHGC